MLAELKRRDIPVLLTGMVAAPNLGADYAKAFDPIYSELATQYGASLYPFILDNVVTDPSLMLDDHIHPNAKGVGVIVQGLAPLRSEEHTSEIQSLMRISYAVFCLKKKKNIIN